MAYLFLSRLALHLLPVFHVPLVHPCCSNSWAEVVSIATIQEIGGRGFGAVAGREKERWSALDKPPSIFSPSAPPFLILLLSDGACVCVQLIRKSAASDIVSVICTLPFMAQARWSTQCLDWRALCLGGAIVSLQVAKQVSNLEAGCNCPPVAKRLDRLQ